MKATSSPATTVVDEVGASTRAPTRTAGLVHAYLGGAHPKKSDGVTDLTGLPAIRVHVGMMKR